MKEQSRKFSGKNIVLVVYSFALRCKFKTFGERKEREIVSPERAGTSRLNGIFLK